MCTYTSLRDVLYPAPMYHFRIQVISRGPGRSDARAKAAYNSGSRLNAAGVVAKAAYRAGAKLVSESEGRSFDYRNKGKDGGVVATAILVPADAPAWAQELEALAAVSPAYEQAMRERLWNMVEAREGRIDAQLAREAQIMLPRELSDEQNLALLLEFTERAFVSRGMIADVAFHMETASDGLPQPHAHVLLTMRGLSDTGFGNKRRDWNDRALVREWREQWAELANQHLVRAGHGPRLDHRRLEDQGLDLEPDVPRGVVSRIEERTRDAPAAQTLRTDIAVEELISRKDRNLARFEADPGFILDQITRTQATFTRRDVERFVFRYCAVIGQDDPAAFTSLVERALGSQETVALGADQSGALRFTTRSMATCEADLQACAARLSQRHKGIETARANPVLSADQQAAARHLIESGDFAALVGYAGAGKTTMLTDVRVQLEGQGYRVRGAALAAVAAKNLTDSAGIEAQTVASLLHGWERRDEATGAPAPLAPLERDDVLVIDEAGLIGARDMARLLAATEAAGAKIVLVGDPQQLQSIDAGAAFRTLVENEGAARLTTVRRQRDEWMRRATVDLAEGRVDRALEAYDAAHHIEDRATTKEAAQALIARWARERGETPSQIILTHARADVAALNTTAREEMRRRGLLGADVPLTVTKYRRFDLDDLEIVTCQQTFAPGDRVLFSRNDKRLGVQNGSLGTARQVSQDRFEVAMDDGRVLAFDPKIYGFIEPGYAMTAHKAQGATVERAYVLATDQFDAHLAYVALSRHRDRVALFYGRDEFATRADLIAGLARQRLNQSTLDYDVARRELIAAADAYAAARGFAPLYRPAAPATQKLSPRATEAAQRAAQMLIEADQLHGRDRHPWIEPERE